MTAPNRPIFINTDLVDRFAAYYRKEDLWGIFHRQLFDGNVKDAADSSKARNDEERELVRLFNLMSPSQRTKLRERIRPKNTGTRRRA